MGTYLAFVGVAVILAITPGPDTLLSLRYALVSRRAGIFAALGTTFGLFIWAVLAALGLAALFDASDSAYYIVSLAGGSYLIWLGARTSLTARARFRDASVITASGVQQTQPASTKSVKATTAFGAGIVTCLTNPKTGLFFLALFPQFTPRESGPLFVIAVLGGTVAAAILLYLLGLVLIVDAANRWLSNPRVTGWIELISGLTLLGLGLYMIATGLYGLLPLVL
nr:LysE family translocator [Garicola koreensis]